MAVPETRNRIFGIISTSRWDFKIFKVLIRTLDQGKHIESNSDVI